MKKGIRYLRFSSVGQSNGSIEWQDLYTRPWFERNNVELIDTFIDAGFSAKTFDRPDMDKLTKFLAKYHKDVDYLVVCEMDRFSRDAGEALTMAKRLQMKYSVQIVSVVEGITFDYRDNGSFFRTGLSLLLAEDENIRRTNKINSGIYTAKAKEGRYINGKVPYGYIKEGKGKSAGLVIDKEKAEIVRFIYDAYLHNTPYYEIKAAVKEKGFTLNGNSCMQNILTAPIYSGQQMVKSWKELPGGLFPSAHEPIIDMFTWQQVQRKIKGDPKIRVLTSDEMPLRGVLHCHCGRLLTGGPSKNRHGNLFYYYRCHTSMDHNHLAAKKVHGQFDEILKNLSLSAAQVQFIKDGAQKQMEIRLTENKGLLAKKKVELAKLEERIESVELKFIANQLPFESYNKWLGNYSQQRVQLKGEIDKYSIDYNEFFTILNRNLSKLEDVYFVWEISSTLQKQELVRYVFDNQLYYEAGSCRTPYLMEMFRHNELILREKKLLFIDKKRGFFAKSPEVDITGLQSNRLEDFFRYLDLIKVA